MKVLLSSRFAEPNPIGSNRDLYMQAKALQTLGVDVEVLTLPVEGYAREIPVRSVRTPECQSISLGGLKYHVVYMPSLWSERVLTNEEWDESKSFFRAVISRIAPDLVHLHAVYGMVQSLEAAQELGISTVYTAHDFGLMCLRNILVMSDGQLCNGPDGLSRCSSCIFRGRNLLGRINETMVKLPIVEALLTRHWAKAYPSGFIPSHGGVRLPVNKRVSTNHERACRVLGELDGIVVPSEFALSAFTKLGVRGESLALRWAYFGDSTRKTPAPRKTPFVFTFVGRISPEKGLDVLLKAYGEAQLGVSSELRIAGVCDSAYGVNLRNRYDGVIGPGKRVVWQGWVDNERIGDLVQASHCGIVPSICQDNVPHALIDILANGRPAICSDAPSMAEVVRDGRNGLIVRVGDHADLAHAMQRICEDPRLLDTLTEHSTEGVLCIMEYARRVSEFYSMVRRSGSGREAV